MNTAQPHLSSFKPLTPLRFHGSLLVALAALLSFVGTCRAQDSQDILPVDQVKPGMKGYAYTIFAGDQIEKFDLVVIGVMPNFLGPKQSIILVQLEGPKVEHTGVVAGMSGSPVYIEGKLAGALSLKFGIFTKEPLAGVTPIEDILEVQPATDKPRTETAEAAAPAESAAVSEGSGAAEGAAIKEYGVPADIAQRAGLGAGAYLAPIETPLVFSGFHPAALSRYAGEFAGYGMVATQGGTAAPQKDDAHIQPGDMVGMVLVQGDLAIHAACTVTALVGDQVYVCGHPLFGFGVDER